MIVKPRFRGFICTTAHPEGCECNVAEQIKYTKSQRKIDGPKRVLVIGASAGYGLASRIVSTFACDAKTIGIFFERPSSPDKTGTAGWYNTAAFEKYATQDGYYAKSINGDAFSDEIKQKTIDLIKKDFGKVDMIIYSLASPRRTDPKTGVTYSSVLKPVNESYTNKTVNFHTGEISYTTTDPATQDEIDATVKVMGGEDWELWIDALAKADVLADGVLTVAYSYIGSELTYAMYRYGTIGMAKDNLEATAGVLNEKLKDINGKAYVSINKALVTQASSAIPVVPLYIALMYKIMKEKGIHEGCIEQIYRLFNDNIYGTSMNLDDKNRIRLDDWEMREDVQKAVFGSWDDISTENINEVTDMLGFRKDFYNLFGFGYDIDYEKDIEVDVKIPGLIE